MATQKRFVAKNGLDNNGLSIINVADPTNAQDVATKAFVLASASASGVSSVNTRTGAVTLTSADVGLGNVTNNTAVANLSGTNTGDQTSVSGNAGTATSIAAGVAGSVPYQTAANTTAMTAASTVAGQVLTTVTAGGAPTWSSTLTGITLGAYQEAVVSITATTASTTVDLSLGSVFVITISANTTLAFSNFPSGTVLTSFTIIMVNDATAGRAVSFPASVTWAGGILPPRTTTAAVSDAWSFFTTNAGTKIVGSLSVANF